MSSFSHGHLEKFEFCAGKPVRPTVASGVDGAHDGAGANFSSPPHVTWISVSRLILRTLLRLDQLDLPNAPDQKRAETTL